MVCDDYFVPALTRVSDALCLTPDVAGATLMAAGSSAPELATSVVAVFVSKVSFKVHCSHRPPCWDCCRATKGVNVILR